MIVFLKIIFMNELSDKMSKTMSFMIFGSLLFLAIGVLTSPTILAVYHILIAVPAIMLLKKTDYKKYPMSAWAFLTLIIIMILSFFFNLDIAVKGLKGLFKLKYFVIAFLSIAPLTWFFATKLDNKKIKLLIHSFCIATTIATLSGLCGAWFDYNPILMKPPMEGGRYGGLFGMVMNYAHNMSFFLIIIAGLLIYRERVKQYVSVNFLVIVFAINLVGFYYSYTRGAWLAFLAGVPFFFFKSNLKKFFIFVFSLILVGGIAYVVAGKNVIRPQSERDRIDQWKAAVYAFKERPVLGFGYLNFEPHSVPIKQRYGFGSLRFSSHAHNNLLEILATTGIVGIVAFVAWMLFWFKEVYSRDDVIAQIGLPFLVVFFVGGLTQSTITLGVNLFFILGAWSLIVASGILKEKN